MKRMEMHMTFAFLQEPFIAPQEQVCRADLATAILQILDKHSASQKILGMASGYLWQTQQIMHSIGEFYDDFEQAMLCQYILQKFPQSPP